MEEKNNGEKKVIKISLTTTIIIAIIVMCLTITATYAFFRLTNKTIHEENKNNLVDNIEEDIAIDTQNNELKDNLIENNLNTIKQQEQEKLEQELYEAAKKASEETEYMREKQEQSRKEIDEFIENMLQTQEPNETTIEKPEKNIIYEEHFLEGITISYPSNWHAHRDEDYFEIYNVDDTCLINLYIGESYVKWPVPEGEVYGNKYGSLYFYLDQFVREGINEPSYYSDYMEQVRTSRRYIKHALRRS